MSKVLRYLKLAEEATFGESPTPVPQITLDIASATLDVPSDTQAIWEGGIGRGPRTHRPGYYSVGGNVVVAVDVHTVAYLLKWALGGYVHTLDSPVLGTNLHEFYGVTDIELPSFVAWLGKDIFEQIVHGGMASQLVLAVSDGYAQITLDVMAAQDEKGVLDEAVLGSLPLAAPLTFPNLRFWVGGTSPAEEESAKIQSLTLTINNNGDAAVARGLGSRFPQRKIPAGQRQTTVEFTSYYDSTAHVERVWGGTDGPSPDGSTELSLRIQADGGADGSLQVDLPRTVFTQVQQQPSGRSRIEQSVAATAFLDTVTLEDLTEVESEIYARLTNDQDPVAAA